MIVRIFVWLLSRICLIANVNMKHTREFSKGRKEIGLGRNTFLLMELRARAKIIRSKHSWQCSGLIFFS